MIDGGPLTCRPAVDSVAVLARCDSEVAGMVTSLALASQYATRVDQRLAVPLDGYKFMNGRMKPR
jgi:hypothetical protein